MSMLLTYVLRHADDNLVLSHRMAQWASRAHDLEEDIALTNIGLDHLGQARSLYGYAAEIEGDDNNEDHFAYFRNERQFTNLLLVEQPNTDFAYTMARHLFFDAYQLGFWEALAESTDDVLRGTAQKALKECTYHWRHSSSWVTRLGDGTEASHVRIQGAIDSLWRFTAELHESDDIDRELSDAGVGVDVAPLREAWLGRIEQVLHGATLVMPTSDFQRSGGRNGLHTEHLGIMLAEMQSLARSHPGATW